MLIVSAQGAIAGPFPGVGRAATPAEIAAWDIDVRPDFKGLAPGSGSVATGQKVWDEKCASCHGTFGESNEVFTPLVGGTTAEDIRAGRVKSLVTGGEARTTLMKLSSIATLWDYIRRAMPWTAPKSLSTEEVYALVAYLLYLGDMVPSDFVLSNRNIADIQARLPNRHGMTRSHGMWDVKGSPDVSNVACMKNCGTEVKLASVFPESAKGTFGDLAEQNRTVGPSRVQAAASGAHSAAPMTQSAAPVKTGSPPLAKVQADIADLAKRKGCLACHGVDKRIVGPGFKEVAAKYKGQPGIEAALVDKLQRGGGGVWGPLPMPPNPDLAQPDARALVQWALGL